MNRCTIYGIIISVIFILSLIFNIYQCSSSKEDVEIETVYNYKDSIIITGKDSIIFKTIYNPNIGKPIDTILVFNGKDTIEISGILKDTLNIDSLILTLKTRDTVFIDTTFTSIQHIKLPKEKKWGFGITIGVSTTYGLLYKKIDIGPSIGIGVTYKF